MDSLVADTPTLRKNMTGKIYRTYFDNILLTIQNIPSIILNRTDVRDCKGVHSMKNRKEQLIEFMNKLMNKLTTNQIEYLYHLTTKLFGETVN